MSIVLRRFAAVSLALCLSPWALSAALPGPGEFRASGPAHGKRIALTFDDGPGSETPRVLALLKKQNVHATFFMLGENAKGLAAIAKQVADDGHEVESHTYTHENYLQRYHALVKQYGDTDEGRAHAVDTVRSELEAAMKKARAAIEAATGRTLHFTRMPYGIDRPWVKDAARGAGFALVNWTFGADWLKDSEETLRPRYLAAVRPGTIFLFHDGGAHRDKTLALVEAVIQKAKAEGYEMVTVSDLLDHDAGSAGAPKAPGAH